MGLSVPIALPDSRFCFVFTCLHYNYNFNLKIMKKQFLLTRMLLLCALIIGSVSSAWGEEITYTFNSKSWGATVDEEEANWTSGKDGNSLQTGQGVQVTAGVTGANATSPVSFTNISKIVVTYSTNSSKGAGNIKIKIGDNTEKTLSVTKTGGTTDRETSVNVSPTESGNVKLTVDCTTNSIYVKSVTITYSSGTATTTTIDASGISNTDVYTSTSAGTLAASVTQNSDASAVAGATVTWSSSDNSVATIGETTGVVTLVAAGTVTFTATYAGNATYAGSSDTYNMTVNSTAPAQPFFLVTKVNDLAAGDKIIIVSGEKAMSTTQNDNNRGATDIKEIKGTDGSILVSVGDDVQILTLEGESDAWYLNTGSGYLYAASDSKNHLRTEEEKDDDNNAKAKITISGGDASIIFQGTNSHNDLKYNSSNSIFSCYASGQTAVQIYKATETATVTSAGWATYVPTHNVAFRSGTKAYIVELADNETARLTPVEDVPADTPVLLEGASGTHTMDFLASSSTDVSHNCLQVSTGASIDGVYVLADGKNGIGFYLWKGGELNEGKVYLQIPTSSREFISLFDDTTTGITEMKDEKLNTKDVFNLNGMRVAQPQKGLYIVNGKKVVLK